MGEANQRGSKEIRIQQAFERNLAWMVVQSSPTGADDSEWTPIMPEDLPEWVKNPQVMGQMRNGEKVSMDPEKGTVWYRGVRVDKPTIQ